MPHDRNVNVFRLLLNGISNTGLDADATQDFHFLRFADHGPGDRWWSRRHA